MKEITTYIAEDGTKFESEYECRDYETKLFSQQNGYDSVLFLFTENGTRLMPSMATEYDFNKVDYIVIKSKEAYEYLERVMYSYYGAQILSNSLVKSEGYNGSFFYNYEESEWYSVKDEIEHLKERIDLLSKYSVDKY